jgi:hypothetical protein
MDNWHKTVRTVVVVLSTGRTGTAALARFFDSSFDSVQALHEPKPTRHLRLLSNVAASGRLSKRAAVWMLGQARRRLLRQLTQPVYIESNWYLYGFLDAMRPVFGNPKVLHIVRDPRTLIPSYLNFGTFRGLKRLVTALLPYWYLRPESCAPNPLGRRWAQLSESERLGWHWYAVNREVERAGEVVGAENYLMLKYEELFASDGSGLRRLLPWIGLPENPELLERIRNERVNTSAGRGNAAWDTIDSTSRRSILRLCGPMMRRYGYDSAAQPEARG